MCDLILDGLEHVGRLHLKGAYFKYREKEKEPLFQTAEWNLQEQAGFLEFPDKPLVENINHISRYILRRFVN